MTPAHQHARRIGLFALVAAALNFLALGLPGGTELLFSPLAYLPLVLVLPAPWAMAVAGLFQAPTLLKLGHPFILVVSVLEAAWLAGGQRRWPRQAVLLDLTFWILIGGPLGYAQVVGLAHLPRDLGLLVVAKQGLNHWTAVALADFLVRHTRAGDWLQARPAPPARLRDTVFSYVFVLALVPLMLFGVGLSTALRRLSEQADQQVLGDSAQRVSQQLGLFLQSHRAAVEELAQLARHRGLEPAVLLEDARRTHPAFLTVLLADASGRVVASAAPAAYARPAPASVADRAFFQMPRRDGRPFASGVFPSRGFGRDTLVALSAPVLGADGRFAGVVEAALEVRQFGQSLVRAADLQGVELILADAQGRVIYADARTGLQPLANLRSHLLAPVLGGGPAGSRFIYDREDPDGPGARYVAYASRCPEFGMVVIAQRPLLASLMSIQWIFTLMLAVLAGVVLTAVLVARAVSRRLSQPLEHFARSAESQATRRSVEPITGMPADAPREVTRTYEAFNHLAVRLRESAALLHRTNEELDARVTARTRELDQARQAAVGASQAKDEFIAMTSHEIRTPLTAIIGLADSLVERAPDAAAADRLRTISRSGERLIGVVNDLLDRSRVEAGQLEVRAEPVDLPELIREVQALLALRAEQLGLALRVELAVPDPFWVRTDAGRLRQILVNLTGNALKFTPRGQVRIRLEAAGDGAAGRRLRFAVSDTGPGLAAEEQAKLFQPYVQLGNAAEVATPGSGLGLVISRRLVELLGGELQLRSTVGQGTEFYFTLTLPLATPPAPPVPAAPAPDTVPGGLRVLVADDNPANQEVIQAMLERRCGGVTVVGGAGAALLRLEAEVFDLALIDLNMPDADGFSVARTVRSWTGAQASRDCRLVAFSAFRYDQVPEDCLAAGFEDFLEKPVSRRELVRVLDETASRLGRT